MLTICLLAIISIVSGLFGFHSKNDYDVLKTCCLGTGLILFICLLTLININSRFEFTKESYFNLRTQVDSYNSIPDSCKNISFEYDIRKDLLKINNIISKHKVMSKSPWLNIWYSKEIGSLEKLNVYGKKE